MVRAIGLVVLLLVASACGLQPEETGPVAIEDPATGDAADETHLAEDAPDDGAPGEGGAGGDGAGDDDPAAEADDSSAPPAARAPDCEDLLISPSVDGPLSDDAAVAAAQQGRAEMGLPSDAATVTEIMATVEGPYMLDFPHTFEEFETVILRRIPRVDIHEARDWAWDEAGDHFGGMWIDPHAGQTVGVTEDTERMRASAAERFDGALVIVEVDHSIPELGALHEEIRDEVMAEHESEAGAPGEGDIAGSGIRESLNRVSIRAIGGEDTAVAISERFGTDMICLDLQPVP